MPAIRFPYNQGYVVANASRLDGHLRVCVDGREKRLWLSWRGFICMHGARMLGVGGETRMVVSNVTNSDGGAGCTWHDLQANEYVLAWWVPESSGYKDFSVYTLVDDSGWPIIVG